MTNDADAKGRVTASPSVLNSPPARPRARRLSREGREREIVEGAVRYFAEMGFGGDTRSLAAFLGVAHPLLFKYFPTKESLIDRVYQEVFLGRWNPQWEATILDSSLPLEIRLCSVYKSYCRTIFNYEWIRIFMFSGLKSSGVNARWLNFIREHLAKPVCAAIREDFLLPSLEQVAVSEMELELVLGISSRIISFGIREFIYHVAVPKDLNAIIENDVRIFLNGARDVIPSIVAKLVAKRTRRVSSRTLRRSGSAVDRDR